MLEYMLNKFMYSIIKVYTYTMTLNHKLSHFDFVAQILTVNLVNSGNWTNSIIKLVMGKEVV